MLSPAITCQSPGCNTSHQSNCLNCGLLMCLSFLQKNGLELITCHHSRKPNLPKPTNHAFGFRSPSCKNQAPILLAKSHHEYNARPAIALFPRSVPWFRFRESLLMGWCYVASILAPASNAYGYSWLHLGNVSVFLNVFQHHQNGLGCKHRIHST